MLALAEAVGEQTAPLERAARAPWKGEAGLRDARATWSTASSTYWDEHRAILRTRNLAAQEGDQRFRDVRNASLQPLTEGLSRKVAENDVNGLAPYAAARGARGDDGAHGRVPQRPRVVRREPRRRRRDHCPHRLPDRDGSRRQALSLPAATPAGWAVSSSSRSKIFSNSSRLRRAPQSSSSGSSPLVWRRRSTSDGLTRAARPVITCLRLRSRPSAMRSSAASWRTRSRCASSSSPTRSSAAFGSPRRCQRTSAVRSRISSGSKPAQLPVRDEVGRVAIVPVVRDVLADVVEERGVLEELAVVVAETVQLAQSGRTGRG